MIVVGVCGVAPMYGVTVYDVIGDPPSTGAVQHTDAWPTPAIALTPVGTPGAVVGAALMCTIEATDGTPLPSTINIM